MVKFAGLIVDFYTGMVVKQGVVPSIHQINEKNEFLFIECISENKDKRKTLAITTTDKKGLRTSSETDTLTFTLCEFTTFSQKWSITILTQKFFRKSCTRSEYYGCGSNSITY